MSLSDQQIFDALESTGSVVCIEKQIVDELTFGPNEMFMSTDRRHSIIELLIPADNERGWSLVEAILFEKEAV